LLSLPERGITKQKGTPPPSQTGRSAALMDHYREDDEVVVYGPRHI